MKPDVKISKHEDMTTLHIKISVGEKEMLQQVANKNSNGKFTALILMLANGKEIK